MMKGTDRPPAIPIDVVEDYTYLGIKIASTLSLIKEIQSKIVYPARVLSTLLYGSE
jgi:hypothetical protein